MLIISSDYVNIMVTLRLAWSYAAENILVLM